jgi:hypothetical protein
MVDIGLPSAFGQVSFTVVDRAETSTWSDSESGKKRDRSTVKPTAAPPPVGSTRRPCRRVLLRRCGRWPARARTRAGRAPSRPGRTGRTRAPRPPCRYPAPVVDSDDAVPDLHLDRLDTVPVELGGVLQEVAHRAFEGLTTAPDDAAVGVEEDRTARAALHPLGGAAGHRGELDGLVGFVATPGEGELDELVHQVAELPGLPSTSSTSRSRAAGGSSPMRHSTLALVRRLVSGVRSSWAASTPTVPRGHRRARWSARGRSVAAARRHYGP